MTPFAHPSFTQNNTHQAKMNFGEATASRRALNEKKNAGSYKKAGTVAALTMLALSVPAIIYKNGFSAANHPQNSPDLKTRTTPTTSPLKQKSATDSEPVTPPPSLSPPPSPSIEEQSYAVYMIGGTILLGTLLGLGIMKKCMGTSKKHPDSPKNKVILTPPEPKPLVPPIPTVVEKKNLPSASFDNPTNKSVHIPPPTPISTPTKPKDSPPPSIQPIPPDPLPSKIDLQLQKFQTTEKKNLLQQDSDSETTPKKPIDIPASTPPPSPKKTPLPDEDPRNFNGKPLDAGKLAEQLTKVRNGLQRRDSSPRNRFKAVNTPAPASTPPSSPAKSLNASEAASQYGSVRSGLKKTDSTPRTPPSSPKATNSTPSSPPISPQAHLKKLATDPFKQFTGKMEPSEREKVGPSLENLLFNYEKKKFKSDFKQFNESIWSVITDPNYKTPVCRGITKDQIESIVKITMKDILEDYTKYSKENKDPRVSNLERLVVVLAHDPQAKDLQDKYLELAKCVHEQFNYGELQRYAIIARTNMGTLEASRQAALKKFKVKMAQKAQDNAKILAQTPPNSPKKLEYSQRHRPKTSSPQPTVEQSIAKEKWTKDRLEEFITTLGLPENYSANFLSMDPSSVEQFAQLLIESNAKINLERYWKIEQSEVTSPVEIKARKKRLKEVLPLLNNELMKFTASQESFWCMISKSEHGYAKIILDTFDFNDLESKKKQLNKLKKIVSGMFKGNFKNRVMFIFKFIEGIQKCKSSKEEKLTAIKQEFEKQTNKLKHKVNIKETLDTLLFNDLDSERERLVKLNKIVSTMYKGELKKRISSFCELFENSINDQGLSDEKLKLNTLKEELEKLKKKLIDEEIYSQLKLLMTLHNSINDALQRHSSPIKFNQTSKAVSITK